MVPFCTIIFIKWCFRKLTGNLQRRIVVSQRQSAYRLEGNLGVENRELKVQVEGAAEGVAVIVASGEIDLGAQATFREALESAASAGAVLIDLSQVTYVDSSGFSTLLSFNRLMRPREIPVFLVGCNDHIKRMLEITRLSSIFTLCANQDEARAALRETALTVLATPA